MSDRERTVTGSTSATLDSVVTTETHASPPLPLSPPLATATDTASGRSLGAIYRTRGLMSRSESRLPSLVGGSHHHHPASPMTVTSLADRRRGELCAVDSTPMSPLELLIPHFPDASKPTSSSADGAALCSTARKHPDVHKKYPSPLSESSPITLYRSRPVAAKDYFAVGSTDRLDCRDAACADKKTDGSCGTTKIIEDANHNVVVGNVAAASSTAVCSSPRPRPLSSMATSSSNLPSPMSPFYLPSRPLSQIDTGASGGLSLLKTGLPLSGVLRRAESQQKCDSSTVTAGGGGSLSGAANITAQIQFARSCSRIGVSQQGEPDHGGVDGLDGSSTLPRLSALVARNSLVAGRPGGVRSNLAQPNTPVSFPFFGPSLSPCTTPTMSQSSSPCTTPTASQFLAPFSCSTTGETTPAMTSTPAFRLSSLMDHRNSLFGDDDCKSFSCTCISVFVTNDISRSLLLVATVLIL